jgi:hypothetical protein
MPVLHEGIHHTRSVLQTHTAEFAHPSSDNAPFLWPVSSTALISCVDFRHSPNNTARFFGYTITVTVHLNATRVCGSMHRAMTRHKRG